MVKGDKNRIINNNGNTGGGRILTCTYDEYTSWYGSLITKVVGDSAEGVTESNEENNKVRKTISVRCKST